MCVDIDIVMSGDGGSHMGYLFAHVLCSHGPEKTGSKYSTKLWNRSPSIRNRDSITHRTVSLLKGF